MFFLSAEKYHHLYIVKAGYLGFGNRRTDGLGGNTSPTTSISNRVAITDEPQDDFGCVRLKCKRNRKKALVA